MMMNILKKWNERYWLIVVKWIKYHYDFIERKKNVFDPVTWKQRIIMSCSFFD